MRVLSQDLCSGLNDSAEKVLGGFFGPTLHPEVPRIDPSAFSSFFPGPLCFLPLLPPSIHISLYVFFEIQESGIFVQVRQGMVCVHDSLSRKSVSTAP